MTAYYNEIDRQKAAWLRELIKEKHIASGEVDERSILDVHPNDVKGFDQCHWFAGIGIWSHALRLAGISDDTSVWTGSCPCQPFSTAGKAGGFDDERHLWPYWHHLIRLCNPERIFGEQVASPDGLAWLDLVQSDLEGEGYSVGANDLCVAGFGAPHIRQRLYWMANSKSSTGRLSVRSGRSREEGSESAGSSEIGYMGNSTLECNRPQHRESRASDGQQESLGGSSVSVKLANAECIERRPIGILGSREIDEENQFRKAAEPAGNSQNSILGDSISTGLEGHSGNERDRGGQQDEARSIAATGAVGGFWKDAEWIPCRSIKVPGAINWRPIKSGTFCLVDGASQRVGLLRGFGDGIVAPVATEFIKAAMSVMDAQTLEAR